MKSRQRAWRIHTPARIVAWQALVRLERRQFCLHLEDVVHQLCEQHNLAARDHALVYELVAGCVRNRTLLEWYLQQCSKHAVSRLDMGLRWVLLLGLYQLTHLERVPAHAAVNETVEVCRYAHKNDWVGYANAVLRTFQRQRAEGNVKEPEDFATRFSHPEWLVECYTEMFGAEHLEGILRWNNTVPRHYARVRGVLSEVLAGLPPGSAAPAPEFGEDVIRVDDTQAIVHSSAFREGKLYIMQPWSVRTARLLKVEPGWRVLDMCAAPGGKSILLADAGAHVVALDNSEHRLRALTDNLRRCHVSGVEPRVLDALEALEVFGPASFDAVLLDAPCANLGVIQRHPEIRWRVEPADLERTARHQRLLLDVALRVVKRGGAVLYAVCSVSAEETKQIVAATSEVVCEREELTRPGERGLDGGYAALVRHIGRT